MSKEARYLIRIDDLDTRQITRIWTDAPLIVEQDKLTIKKLSITGGDLKLESYNLATGQSTPITGNIDRAYVASKLHLSENYI